jgi:hypothetical protein
MGSQAPDQVPLSVGDKRPAALSGSTPPVKCPYMGVWKPRFVQLSLPFFFLFFILLLPFFVQILTLRHDRGDGRGCRRCGCWGSSGAGSCQ